MAYTVVLRRTGNCQRTSSAQCVDCVSCMLQRRPMPRAVGFGWLATQCGAGSQHADVRQDVGQRGVHCTDMVRYEELSRLKPCPGLRVHRTSRTLDNVE